MSRISDELRFDVPRDIAMARCSRAVLAVGWEVAELHEYRIVPRIGVGLTRNPMRIEIVVDSDGDGSVVRIDGRILGFGPIQKGHLKSRMNQLKIALLATSG